MGAFTANDRRLISSFHRFAFLKRGITFLRPRSVNLILRAPVDNPRLSG